MKRYQRFQILFVTIYLISSIQKIYCDVLSILFQTSLLSKPEKSYYSTKTKCPLFFPFLGGSTEKFFIPRKNFILPSKLSFRSLSTLVRSPQLIWQQFYWFWTYLEKVQNPSSDPLLPHRTNRQSKSLTFQLSSLI